MSSTDDLYKSETLIDEETLAIPEDYVAPAAEVTENLPPQCSF